MNSEHDALETVFVKEILSAFDFLASDYGFRCVAATPVHIRYESKHVFVNIYRDPVSYEIEVEIGRRSLFLSIERGYTLDEIVDSLGIREKEGYCFIQASTPERLRSLVPLLAKWTKQYAPEMLKGRLPAFLRALISRERRSDDEWKRMELGSIRARADNAWHQKDYREVIKQYSSIGRGELTPSEVKKLEYAKKRLRG